jgi:hypothetical protein
MVVALLSNTRRLECEDPSATEFRLWRHTVPGRDGTISGVLVRGFSPFVDSKLMVDVVLRSGISIRLSEDAGTDRCARGMTHKK